MSETFVVVGGGLAAGKALEELRDAGFDGELVLYGEEHHLPYERPPLSKGYLLGDQDLEKAFVHGPEWYDEREVDLRLGTTVTSLDVSARTVTADDKVQHYDRLLLATGATPRRLALADESGAQVVYLRRIEDSDRLKEAFRPGLRLVVLGGGWIGLEVAAAARASDVQVTVVEMAELPLLAVLGPEVAAVFADLHREHGVDLRTGVQATRVEPSVVHLSDGTSVPADLLVVGVGVTPHTQLAETAGLAVDNGILVDASLRTSAAGVWAAGDVANAEHPLLGGRVRVEHWDNAIEQGRTAAHSMLGHQVSYDRLPYFFTDQYDLGMEYVGHVGRDGYDHVVVRGDTHRRVFTAFWLRGSRVLAGMHANDWDAIGPIRRLVGSTVEPNRLRDESLSLDEVAEATG